jgi:DNA-binding response OmpR family regulator
VRAVPERILLIDDEPAIVRLLSRALSGDGYQVESADTGTRGLERARAGSYDLVVLDLRLPDVDGVTVLEELLAARPEQRVLVLSVVSDVDLRVHCLELGAADYLVKPFTLEEFRARVRARLQHAAGPGKTERFLKTGTLTLDLGSRMADSGGRPVHLSEREFLLLEHLVRHAGDVCSREELLGEVWGYSFDPGTNVVEVYVGRLRAKLGDIIETVRGVGYSLRIQ